MEKIKEQRAQAVTKLKELQEIKPKIYTAMELHPRRQMLARVQRQEQRRYHEEVGKQKLKFKKDISDMDKYLASVKEYDKYMMKLPKQNGDVPMMLPVPVILPAPTIVFGKRPMLKETKIKRYKRRGRY